MRAAFSLLVSVCSALAGCGDAGSGDIQYASNDMPLGKWSAQVQPGKAGNTGGTSASTDSSPTALDMERADAAISSEADSGVGDSKGGPVMASAGAPATVDKPSAPVAGAAAATGSRLAFSVLTEVQHMRLAKNDPAFDDDARGPENMGAIWISKPDGTFVRSLEVWRLNKERSRHLVAYNKACQCPKPDVIATATLTKHREHMVSWDMSSRDGTRAPEGSYTIHVEVADYDVDNPDKPDPTAMNAQWSLDFDTHAAPKTLMPEAAAFYTGLKLELLK